MKFEAQESQNDGWKKPTVAVATTVAAVFVMLLVGCYYIKKVRRKQTGKITSSFLRLQCFMFLYKIVMIGQRSKIWETNCSGEHPT